jgi:hypothetical protein
MILAYEDWSVRTLALKRDHVVARQAVFTHQPSKSPPERKTRHSSVGNDATSDGGLMRPRRIVEVGHQRPGFDRHGAGRRIDIDAT